uniref:protein O-GlcNAc transferase n=2 Tax=Tetraselmis sp. GSL018 TaxID=582737 RepID=A0A061RFK4_9CHLO
MAGLVLQPGALYGSLVKQQNESSGVAEDAKELTGEYRTDILPSQWGQLTSALSPAWPQSSAASYSSQGAAMHSLNALVSQHSPAQQLLSESDARTGLSQQSDGLHHSHGADHFTRTTTTTLGPDGSQVEVPHITSSGFTPPSVLSPGVVNYEELLRLAHTAYRSGEYRRALTLAHPYYLAYPTSTSVLLLIGAIYYQLRNYEQCIAFNDRCILLDPTMAEAHANMANALQQSGNLDMAIIYYQSALRLKPTFTDAYNNMAGAFIQKGMLVQAIECYNAALRINPNLADVHSNLGDLWKMQGESGRQSAEREYFASLSIDRQYAPAWRGLGDLYRDAGNFDQALGCFHEATRARPSYAEAFTGMGLCLKELKRLDEAEEAYKMVVKLRPSCALSIGNLAGICYERNKLEAAIALYRQAIQLEPNFPEAYNNLGNALREAGRADEAIACYTACIQLQFTPLGLQGGPAAVQRLCVAYNNLSGILKMQGRVAESIQCYEQVATLQPESPEAHANLASTYKDSARHDLAIVSYKRALALRPDFPEAFANLVHSLQCVCSWTDRQKLFQRLTKEVLRDIAAGRLPPVQPFHAMAYPFAADLALTISRKYAEHCAKGAARLGCPALAHPPARRLVNGERLRVGYVSSDFGNHPLSHLMNSVFGLHNRDTVEVFCYALSPPDGSEWRTNIQNDAEHFLDVSSWTTVAIAHKISEDRIQVLINLNGYTKGARNEIFALRPAPVQASYMGFPATTGADYLPYLITDKVVAPPSLHHCYSEHLVLMPHCYFVNDHKQSVPEVLDTSSAPPPGCTRGELGLPEDKIVYHCSNQLYKYDPETFTTWCNILRRVPDSVLWLLRFPPYGEPNIRSEAAARGVDPARIIFTDVAAKATHIRRSGLADVFLDTPLCNAHTTGCDVLWAGTPIVTLPLERMASRVAASLCTAAGFGPEMVVESQQEYEERAVELGTNHGARLDLRRRLCEARLTCPLFDTKGWVEDFERVLLQMWEIHASGESPRSFELEPRDPQTS